VSGNFFDADRGWWLIDFQWYCQLGEAEEG